MSTKKLTAEEEAFRMMLGDLLALRERLSSADPNFEGTLTEKSIQLLIDSYG